MAGGDAVRVQGQISGPQVDFQASVLPTLPPNGDALQRIGAGKPVFRIGNQVRQLSTVSGPL